MSNSELLIRIRNLHDELVSINDELSIEERVDDATVDALGQLVTDVGELVEQAQQSVPQVQCETRHSELMDRALDWETNHPAITRFLSQVTDLLAMMGI